MKYMKQNLKNKLFNKTIVRTSCMTLVQKVQSLHSYSNTIQIVHTTKEKFAGKRKNKNKNTLRRKMK